MMICPTSSTRNQSVADRQKDGWSYGRANRDSHINVARPYADARQKGPNPRDPDIKDYCGKINGCMAALKCSIYPNFYSEWLHCIATVPDIPYSIKGLGFFSPVGLGL